MWFECAGSNDDTPPTTGEIEAFLEEASNDKQLVKDVYHRFVLTRGGRKFISWMKASFFFRNATKEQLQKMFNLVDWKI